MQNTSYSSSLHIYKTHFKMQSEKNSKFSIWVIFLTCVSILYHGRGEECSDYGPTVQQTQVGFKDPPRYKVEVENKCPMCPVINIHIKCDNFSQALVKPRLFKVLKYNDCVINGGLPLGPLQKFAFNYSHRKYPLFPTSWNFQCE